MIAGIVLAHGATLATRNVQHFSDLSLDIGYRYLDVGDVRSGTTETVLGVLQPPITASKSGDLGVHTLIASLRYGF